MYALTYEADYEQFRSRALVALRPILALPWLVVWAAYLTAALFWQKTGTTGTRKSRSSRAASLRAVIALSSV